MATIFRQYEHDHWKSMITREDYTQLLLDNLKRHVSGTEDLQEYSFMKSVPERLVDLVAAGFAKREITTETKKLSRDGEYWIQYWNSMKIKNDLDNIYHVPDSQIKYPLLSRHAFGPMKVKEIRKRFKEELIKQRLYDFDEQWNYYLDCIASQHLPEDLYRDGYIKYSQARTAQNIYDLNHRKSSK